MSDNKASGTDAVPSKLNKNDTVALKVLLVERLSECGWRDSIQELVRNKLLERGTSSIDRVELYNEITPLARALVPEDVRKEMLLRVREALESNQPLQHD